MRILFFTNLFPYPLDNGGKIKTYSTLRALKEIGGDIDLICFSEDIGKDNENIKKLEAVCEHITLIPHKLSTKENMWRMMFIAAKSLVSRYPFIILKYKNWKMYGIAKEKLMGTDYDIVYFDHLQMFIYYDLLKKYIGNAKIVIDQHNCESQIIARTIHCTDNVLKRYFLRLEHKKITKYESKSLSLAEKVFVVSLQDLVQMKKIGARIDNASILPIAVMDNGIIQKNIKNSSGEISLLFVGTLTWNPNDEGICRFVENVVPLLKKSNILYKLYIVGKNPSTGLRELCRDNSNLIITGYVEDISEYYCKSDVMIVPLFIGGGQRVKIIEAFSKGIPVISTTIGAEGLKCVDGQSIIIADDAPGFIRAIELMMDEERRKNIAAGGRMLYEQEYSLNTYCAKYKDEIKELL